MSGISTNQVSADANRWSFLRSVAGILTGLAAVLSAVGGLYAAGALRGSSATPIGTFPPPSAVSRSVDCTQVTHPPYGSALRTAILDAARVHDRYEGRYDVKDIAKLGDWAYVEIAPLTTGEYASNLLEFDGTGWNWRWKGSIGAAPDDPSYPTGFAASAQNILVCPSS